MKKSKIAILSIVALTATLVIGGTIMSVQNKSLFTDDIFGFQSPREKQLTYLKKHEKDLADFVKSLSPKVKSVQFDWDSMKVEDIGNGTPQGGGYMLTLRGKVNNNDKSISSLRKWNGNKYDYEVKSWKSFTKIGSTGRCKFMQSRRS